MIYVSYRAVETKYFSKSAFSLNELENGRLEVSIPLSPPQQQGPLEKNMPMPNDGHFNYRLIQWGYL